MLRNFIRGDHAATYVLAFQKPTALKYHVQTSSTSCLHDPHTHTHTHTHPPLAASLCTHTMLRLGMYHTLGASRSTHASAHHKNFMTEWGYVLYRSLGVDSPFPHSIYYKTLTGCMLSQWLQNSLTASVGDITILLVASPALLILQKEPRSYTCLITVR